MRIGRVLVLWLAAAGVSHAQAYQAPRSSDGRPDFQGVWSSAWLTPLERPAEAKSLVLTDDDADALREILWRRIDDADPFTPLESIDVRSLALIGGKARSSLIVDPADGRLPFTEETRRRRQPPPTPGFEGPEARPPSERCIVKTNSMAPMMVLPAGNMKQIVQTQDHLVILSETYTQARIIPLNDRARAAASYGRGRWEGDTLVVESSGFALNDRIRAAPYANFPISPASRIVERFTRTSEDEILYSFEVEDASLYVRPWKAEMPLSRSKERVFEWACHEANYSLTNMLQGARVVEARAAEPPKK